MHFFFHAVQSVFQTFYGELVEQLNSNDITADLFAAKIISANERDEADNRSLPMQERNKQLLRALERTIIIDYHNFSTFFNISDKHNTYKPLVDKIKGELNK